MRFDRTWSFVWTLASAVVVVGGKKKEEEAPECGLYMAVSSSSTVEEPKWGIYAGKKYKAGEDLGFGDVAIQTFHLLGSALLEDEDAPNPLLDVVEFVEGYIWVPNSSGGQFELAEGRTVTAIGGMGILGGFNLKLTNADWNHSLAVHREAWNEEPGVSHPGRGAQSHFYDVRMQAHSDIPAGMEIFVNYGDAWAEENDEEGRRELTPSDFEKVDVSIEKMIKFFDKHSSELDEESTAEIYNFLARDVMAAAAGSHKGAAIADLLPRSPDGLPAILEGGGSMLLASPNVKLPMDWLQEHGRCIDNIRPGPSTIPHAGRGAFATRKIAAGSLVAPVPLVQIPRERILDIYPVKEIKDEEDETYWIRDADTPYAKQLLLNYCYGHRESKMLFFPSGAAAGFINHSKKPNAKMVWSDHPSNHKHWFELNPDELIRDGNNHLGLIMDIVATKDIKEGEEVFIDYGDEWVEAWDAHVKKWKQLVKEGELPSKWNITALDLNSKYASEPFPLSVEASHPDNVDLKCFLTVDKDPEGPHEDDDGNKLRVWHDSGRTMRTDNLFDCTITEKVKLPGGDFNYTIRWEGNDEAHIVSKIPHKAIVFMDKPGTSDQFLTQAFRHYIAIPDDIFPQGKWRNLNVDDEDIEDEYGDFE